jgi:hypothetical protein
MPKEAEKILVDHFKTELKNRKNAKIHPWFCKEGYGQAFLAWGYK